MDSIVSDSVGMDGVALTELRQIVDQRGAVLHMVRADAATDPIGECYFSEVLPGVVKAWKRHRRQTQNLAVPVGRVRLVLCDDRDPLSSPLVHVRELGRPDAYLRVRIPPGIWYGFACVGDVSALVANCPDLPHDPTESEAVPADDERIPYRW